MFIKYINPKLVITTIDNNINFYKLKNILKIKFVVIQNGARHKINDIFGNLEIEKFILENNKCADTIFT